MLALCVQQLATVESLDYLPPNSRIYRNYGWSHPDQHMRIHWGRWVMMGSIGFATGLVGYLVKQLTEMVNEGKYLTAGRLIDEDRMFEAWLFSTGYATFFAVLSSLIVIIVSPAAAGSGIPEVIGYLNGCNIHNIFNIKTVFAKFFSAICAVGSGLPVGPEGPMIHLGAMLGAGLSQGRSSTIGCVSSRLSKYRNTRDRRDFITAGAAAGVSTAFGAPVGGLLFGMEEVASFWDANLLWQMFFCSMIATFTIDLFASGMPSFHPQSDFGAFKDSASILFLSKSVIHSNIVMFIPAVILGAMGGGLGAVFTFLNLKVARWRKKNIIHTKWRRVAEVAAIMILYGSITFIIPMAFDCTPITEEHSHLKKSVWDCGDEVSAFCESDVAHVTPFTCARQAGASHTEPEKLTSYNEMASIMFTSAENAIHVLFSRHTYYVIGAGECFIMLLVYFMFSCWAAGSAIASGLVVPMLMTGACLGRGVGLLFVEITSLWEPDVADASVTGYWDWVDPGLFALLGAAAFFGGVSRLTISLTIILIEITNEVRLLLPLMTAIITAKAVADLLTHSLYHALLELKCVPFLPNQATSAVSLDLFQAQDVMASPVVCIARRSSVKEIADVLKETKHHIFPVVDTMPGIAPRAPAAGAAHENEGISREHGVGCRAGLPKQVVLGSISRDVLELLLQDWLTSARRGGSGEAKAGLESTGSGSEITYPDLLDRADRRHRARVRRSQFEDFEGVESAARELKAAEDDETTWMDIAAGAQGSATSQLLLDLTNYVNESQHRVSHLHSLERTYILFRTMGLRALVITDAANGVAGILTRKDLLGYKIEECIEPILEERGLVGEHTKFAGGHAPVTSRMHSHSHGDGHGHAHGNRA